MRAETRDKAAASRRLSAASRDAGMTGRIARLSHLVGLVFGYLMLALAAVVTFETIARKLLGFSLQGVDELGGYALAVGSSLAFTTALVERGHIRIDLFHMMLPRPARAVLDWLSVLLIAAFAGLLVKVGASVLADTIEYRSTAPTPLATPLIWPQALWLGALGIFTLVALVMAAHATWAFVTGRWSLLARLYGPKSADEEIREEIEDLKHR
jgi:TRAP-type C4-dicarboxylate transport system permease small subunit